MATVSYGADSKYVQPRIPEYRLAYDFSTRQFIIEMNAEKVAALSKEASAKLVEEIIRNSTLRVA